MSRLVVLHASDLHLDAPFEGVGRVPAPVATALRDASVDAWDALVDLALAREVAAVLLAGGLCDGLERGVRAQARLRSGLDRLSAAGIPVFIALGEDDPLGGFAAIPEWPATVTVFPSDAPTAVPLRRDGRLLATVHGLSAGRRSLAAAGARGFERGDAPGPHLAVLHAAIAGHDSDDGAGTRHAVSELRAAGMDYWALGCAPATDYLATDVPWIVYSGTLQGRGLALPQCGAKGAVLVEIEDGAVTRVDFEPLDRVRCLRVELTGGTDPAALTSALRTRANELREDNPGRGLVLEARVDASPAMSRMLRQPLARAEWLRALRRAADGLEPFVWWAGVRPAPPPVRACGVELVGDDVAVEVARRRAVLANDTALCAQFLARQFEPLRDTWTADVDPREAGALLDEAAAVAVDALREDGA